MHIRGSIVTAEITASDETAKDISTLQSIQLRYGDDVYLYTQRCKCWETLVGRVSMCWHCANKMEASLAFILSFLFGREEKEN